MNEIKSKKSKTHFENHKTKKPKSLVVRVRYCNFCTIINDNGFKKCAMVLNNLIRICAVINCAISISIQKT